MIAYFHRHFGPIVNSALEHYCNKLATVLNGNEIIADNRFLKTDLSENLSNAQSTLEVLTSKDQDTMNSIQSKVWENLDMIKKALLLYAKDIRHSSNIAAEKLNNMEFPRVENGLRAISSTVTYIQNLKP